MDSPVGRGRMSAIFGRSPAHEKFALVLKVQIDLRACVARTRTSRQLTELPLSTREILKDYSSYLSDLEHHAHQVRE